MEYQIELKKIENTLEEVEVHGSQNLNSLLACILALRQVRAELEQEEKEAADEPVES